MLGNELHVEPPTPAHTPLQEQVESVWWSDDEVSARIAVTGLAQFGAIAVRELLQIAYEGPEHARHFAEDAIVHLGDSATLELSKRIADAEPQQKLLIVALLSKMGLTSSNSQLRDLVTKDLIAGKKRRQRWIRRRIVGLT